MTFKRRIVVRYECGRCGYWREDTHPETKRLRKCPGCGEVLTLRARGKRLK